LGHGRTHGAGAVFVDGAAGDLRLGTGAPGPAVPLAAVRQRSGVSLVHPPPEPDRAAGLGGPGAGAAFLAGAGGRDRGNGRRLPAAARMPHPARALAAPPVRPEAPARNGARTATTRQRLQAGLVPGVAAAARAAA